MSEVLFTAHATAEGGRDGRVKSDDGVIDLNVVMPNEKKDETGTNPEQLFAAAYAACYDGALNLVASKEKKDIESTLKADVSLMKDPEDGGFKIGVVLNIDIKGVTQEEAEALAQSAHQVCPYSKATRGNVDVQLNPKAV
ncbi:organic hydroperoxide resistance protein OhrB [Thalassobacillus devorans]|uniref:Organic hydroperoxide resistance protein OhrB n=1 Tax=Thalassobacillus devorans TaxID=279813 RepID=A0ABQ1PQF5_9BACI|nr:organic hydroperoxide resistance protein [Thalassobacillus devorans]NIK30315.1 Ohr subfamily peroxiredoxin [Thalassobacillus devorans]GGD01245.1 organic hydroperoxide resistance protein OhrB [Thalassobacillus devorans]